MKKAREDLNKTVDLTAIYGAERAKCGTHSFQGHMEKKYTHAGLGRSTDYVLGIQHNDARNQKRVAEKVEPLHPLARIYRPGHQQQDVSPIHTASGSVS